MPNQFVRTEILLGKEAMDKLASCRVAVFGIGGVGGYAAEGLARGGVFGMDLIDNDLVCDTNINRQLVATHKTIGKNKTDVMKERILAINPEAIVHTYACFYTADNAEEFDFKQYDYIVDAIDTVSSKLTLIERAKKAKTPIISCMGAGNKLDPTQFEVADIRNTSVCPLAKVMRRELKTRGIDSLKVVYSKETPLKPMAYDGEENARRQTPGSVSFVPSVAGLIMAGEVIKDLCLLKV